MDFIAADLRDMKTALAPPMLCAFPGAQLVDIDALTNTLIVLNGESRPTHSMQDALDVIRSAA